MDGKGTYEWADGAIYEGEFKKNSRCGKGKLIYGKASKNNLIYEGEFQFD